MLPADMQARFVHIGDLLAAFGPYRVGMPHVRPLRDKLWEMRLHGRAGIARAIYFMAERRRIVVVRAYVKKTAAAPSREIALARRRMREFQNGEDA